MEPQRFGRYEIKAEIGRGGMATVYHAYDPRFEREVAIKVLPREMLHDPQFRTRFEREAKTIAMLEHPAIVPVYDFGEEDGQPYFVMRYMTGGSLSERLKNGPLPLKEAARILEHIAPALDEAHAKGIIHRDLKPGNILFDQYNEPYISDFGIAKFAASQTNVTGSAIVGTPAYMSPEQAQGEGSVDGRSDIYGLGVILFEMLTGIQPYQGNTPMSVVVKHITEPVPHILDVLPSLPPALETVIEKAMAKDRDQRFGSVRAVAEALNAVVRGETPDLESADVTRVAYTKTAVSKPPASQAKTVLAGKGEQVPTGAAAPRKPGLWIGLGVAALLVCVAAAGVIIFKDKIPFLAGPAPTATPTSPGPSSTPQVQEATRTNTVVLPPAATDTPTASPTVPVSTLPTLGGADLVAFLSANNIWLMQVDGGSLVQVTRDGAAKHDLQWSPDGKSLFFLSGKCIKNVTIPDGQETTLACFTAADYLEAFEISPDGTQVAISLNRELFVVPFDLAAIGKARNWTQLRDMKGCFTLTGDNPGWVAVKGVRWSNNGKRLAADVLSVEGSQRVDLIRVFDISKCYSTALHIIDNFPAGRFSITHSGDNRTIPSFDWDGETLFILNSPYRFLLGYMYAYNLDTQRSGTIDPMQTSCCYSQARWSPDGSYLLFFYQDIAQAATSTGLQLFYVPYGSIGTGATYTPFNLPPELLGDARSESEAALRPAK
jgi:serine/threonine protein kinase